MVTKKTLAIIPARGGSKRIPNKNIIDFCGKPMIIWTIEAAKNSGLFQRIIVSTDDPAIADVCQSVGIEVPFLRDAYCDDYSPISDATIYALRQTMTFYKSEYATVVQLMANCPLRSADDIIRSYNNFVCKAHSFQISCFKYGWMNPWWAAKIDDQGEPERIFPQTTDKRSQDLEDLYCPSGAIWIAKVDDLLEQGTFYGSGHIYYPLDWKAAIDIDTLDDLEMAIAISTVQTTTSDSPEIDGINRL